MKLAGAARGFGFTASDSGLPLSPAARTRVRLTELEVEKAAQVFSSINGKLSGPLDARLKQFKSPGLSLVMLILGNAVADESGARIRNPSLLGTQDGTYYSVTIRIPLVSGNEIIKARALQQRSWLQGISLRIRESSVPQAVRNFAELTTGTRPYRGSAATLECMVQSANQAFFIMAGHSSAARTL